MTHRRSRLVLVGGLLVCLPCLLPALVALAGVAALTALGSWLAGHAALLALGASVALVSLGVAAWLALALTRMPACSAEEVSEP